MIPNPDDDIIPAPPPKSRKRRFRERRQEAGYRQIAVWLDGDAYFILRHFMQVEQVDAADVLSRALRSYSPVPRDNAVVPSPVPSPALKVPRDASAGGRYMPPALEDRILALRQSGLSLSATARQLAEEGHFNAKGDPYSTSTVSKAEARAKARAYRLSAPPPAAPIEPPTVSENETISP